MAGSVYGQAEAVRRIRDVVDTGLILHRDVRGVDRRGGRRAQIDFTEGCVAVVADGIALDLCRGVAIPDRVQADALLYRRRECEGLEGRSGLRKGSRGVVDRVGHVVRPAIHRDHFARAGPHGDEADAQALRALGRADGFDGRDSRRLGSRVEGRDDAQAPRLDLLVGVANSAKVGLDGLQ